MINKPLIEIDISDIQYLVDNKVEESRTLEYKRELDGGKYGSSEFLADFIAFANSGGGDLIIGVEEGSGIDKGKPVDIPGIPIKNEDEDRLTLNNTIRDKVSPRFMDFQSHYIQLDNGYYVVVIRIKQSWNKPHMINNASRDFFVRNTSGKHTMDISEIRSSIFATRTDKEQLAEFRENRLLSVMANTINDVYLKDAPRIVIHAIPFTSFSEAAPSIPVKAMEGYKSPLYISPRLNFDGRFMLIDEGSEYSYIQLFRNGIFEYAKAVYTESMENYHRNSIRAFDPSVFKEVIFHLENGLEFLSANGVDTPISLSVSLVGFKGVSFWAQQISIRPIGHILDRDLLILPEVIVTDYSANLLELLQDNLDIISNAFGLNDGWLRGLWNEK